MLVMEISLGTGSYMLRDDVSTFFRNIQDGDSHYFRRKRFFSKLSRFSFDLLWFSFDLAAPGAPPGGNRC